jgi:hypothetical protein
VILGTRQCYLVHRRCHHRRRTHLLIHHCHSSPDLGLHLPGSCLHHLVLHPRHCLFVNLNIHPYLPILPMVFPGQLSTSSGTPSPSLSFCESEHPSVSTDSPDGVPGQLSTSSGTPSPSLSFCESEHPSSSTDSPDGVPGQLSTSSGTPSPSLSFCESEHPSVSTDSPDGVPGSCLHHLVLHPRHCLFVNLNIHPYLPILPMVFRAVVYIIWYSIPVTVFL